MKSTGSRKSEVLSLVTLLSVYTFAHCAVFAAPVLDGKGIRIEFDSEERGFDCLAIKNKLGGETVPFGDGASDAKRGGLWTFKFWENGSPSKTRWLTNHSPSKRSVKGSDG